jgi:hypothetical protein
MTRDANLFDNILVRRSALIFDFVAGGERFQVTTTYDSSKRSHRGIVKAVITLYPERERLVGYIICMTTMEAFDADERPLGKFPDRDCAMDAILAAYLLREADQ